MNIKKLGAVVLFLMVSCRADAADPGATLLQCLMMLAIDYGQTQDIKNRPGFVEENTLLGSHPTAPAVRGYFAGLALGYTAINHYFPAQSKIANLYCVASHGITAENNLRVGVGWSF